MALSSRTYKQNREEKYSKWEAEQSKRDRAIAKDAAKANRKIEPKLIREDCAKNLTQSIFAEQKAIYEKLYEKIEAKAEELTMLILKDLGLDKDVNKNLSAQEILDVFSFYKDKGLLQINNAITEDMVKNYFPNRITPYQKMFKNLISKRAEFLIVAPKERLSLSMPYKKLKEEDVQISLVKHLAELKIIQNNKFAEKFPALAKIYNEIQQDELKV